MSMLADLLKQTTSKKTTSSGFSNLVIPSNQAKTAAAKANGTYGKGYGVLAPQARSIPVAPSNPQGLASSNWAPAPAAGGGGGGGGWVDPGVQAANNAAYAAEQKANAAIAKANSEGKAASKRQNDATRTLADGQRKLIDSFGSQRDIKLTNISEALNRGSKLLLDNYGSALGGLEKNRASNDAAEADASFSNIANAVRERGELLSQATAQGAGETDQIKTQLQALRNYSANQSDVNRAYFDTLNSVNNSIRSLNNDTATSRTNMFNQAETDKESAWANYYNQTADTWTQIANIENSNTNTTTDSSEEYKKKYGDAADQAAKSAKGSYKRVGTPSDYTNWAGKGKTEERKLSSSNRAASVNLGGPMKTPEGATLRKW